jgi:hypothetical protein
MKRAQPRGVSRRRIQHLLSSTRSNPSVGARIELLSREFLGRPYTTAPLIGSAEQPEEFIASLDGFDCVTYVETVLALACASKVDEFSDWLRRIRYESGVVDWKRRNHYMTRWIHNNTRIGAVRRVSMRVPLRKKLRTLGVIPGLPTLPIRFECAPKTSFSRFKRYLKTGDIIFFASIRKYLDVFHCGVLVRENEKLRLRHASRRNNGVVEQDLNEFLKGNRMAGLIVVRPAEGRLR